jgi:NADH-ubiquinone oxidoreductase chain 1
MYSVLFNLIEVLIVLVPMLLAIAFMTIIERKQLAAMQRRVGPNTVGIFGILQPFYHYYNRYLNKSSSEWHNFNRH